MVGPHRYFMALLVVLLLSGGSATLHAHQDPCHRLHGCQHFVRRANLDHPSSKGWQDNS